MDKDELIQQLMDALEKSSEAQDKYEEALDKLDEENKLLSDTIVKNNLGKINEERRKLLQKAKETDESAYALMSEAESIKSEYESKLDKIAILIKDVKSKQGDIDSYINSEAESKVADVKADYIKHKKANDKALTKHKAENDALLQEQLNKYKQQHKIIIVCGIVSVIIGILGFLF